MAGIVFSTGAAFAQAAEFPVSVEAALAEFRACVGRSTSLTTPEMVPDPDVRRQALEALLGGCETLHAQSMARIALKDRQAGIEAEVAALTAELIEAAKSENGL